MVHRFRQERRKLYIIRIGKRGKGAQVEGQVVKPGRGWSTPKSGAIMMLVEWIGGVVEWMICLPLRTSRQLRPRKSDYMAEGPHERRQTPVSSDQTMQGRVTTNACGIAKSPRRPALYWFESSWIKALFKCSPDVVELLWLKLCKRYFSSDWANG
ncbi:hypothetical protein BDN67DRAFT_428372 [Paxillus ammoniavirescens]|nr:hypothetical protein BDN67DRAFT_428372 [Paxillus ammoniavirescens]